MRALIDAYYAQYGGHIEEIDAAYFGAYDGDGLAGVMAWIDAPAFRFVKEWATVGGRRGLRASAALVRIARQRLVVGHVALANEDARRWIAANGGSERAVLIELPEARHGGTLESHHGQQPGGESR